MNNKKILAFILSLCLIVCCFSACGDAATPGEKNDAEITETPDSFGLADDTEISDDVTAITAATDTSGKVVDKVGITDIAGHKVYSTGSTDVSGKPIYTTGKPSTTGEILYTKNETDSFGNLIYYKGEYDESGKLHLTPTDESPDYTTNEKPTDKVVQGTTTTTTTVGADISSKKTIKDAVCKYTKYYGGTGLDIFSAIDADDNGGYVAVGITDSRNGSVDTASNDWGGDHSSVAKYDADGALTWKYVVGGDGNVVLSDVAVLKDGTIIAVGYSSATDIQGKLNSSMLSGLIIRIAANGDLMWMYSFPGDTDNNGEYISSVAATTDGGFVVGGKSVSTAGFFSGTSEKGSKGFLFKFDKNCNIKWRKILTGSRSANFSAIDVNSKGEIFATCVTTSTDGDFSAIRYNGATTSNTLLLKVSKNGDLDWVKYLESTGNSEYNTVKATSDGGCIIGGSFTINKKADGIYSMSYGESDGFIIRYAANGDVRWSRVLGGSAADYVEGITEIDGGYVVVGRTKSIDCDFQGQKMGGEEDGFLVYLNEKGELLTSVLLDGTMSDSATDVCTLKDGTVAISGWTKSKDNAFNGSGASKQYMAFVSRYEAETE